MKIADFSELTITDQLELLYKGGVYLCKRKQGFTSIILYQFERLYVEIYYAQYRSTVSHIFCSESTEIIYPYLAQIDIGGLFESS
jgi:hypothetical protein